MFDSSYYKEVIEAFENIQKDYVFNCTLNGEHDYNIDNNCDDYTLVFLKNKEKKTKISLLETRLIKKTKTKHSKANSRAEYTINQLFQTKHECHNSRIKLSQKLKIQI